MANFLPLNKFKTFLKMSFKKFTFFINNILLKLKKTFNIFQKSPKLDLIFRESKVDFYKG